MPNSFWPFSRNTKTGAPLASAPAVAAAAPTPDRQLASGIPSPGSPVDEIARKLSGKVLHGWLQNQHQTLVPFTMRADRLEPHQLRSLMRFAAVALLSGSSVDDRRRAAMEAWLRSIAAGDSGVDAFDAALREPPALNEAIHEVEAAGIAPQAYAATVVAADQRELSGRLFSHYVAARLALPAHAVRSVNRQFRR